MLQQSIDQLKQDFTHELEQARKSADIEALRVKYLGKKGPIQQLMKELKDATPEERPLLGKVINDLKQEIAAQIESHYEALIQQEETLQLEREKIDITLPGRRKNQGRKHLISLVMDDMINILAEMGFSVQYGPDIDTDYYNFEALNFPPDHPARDMQDTFYITPGMLLRTHTSNIQARIMESTKPPIRIIAPGKVYRNETITARSHVFFHQIEGFYVDKNVNFADLFATLKLFFSKFYRQEVETRFRPSYFPFVEPGLEIDIRCMSCSGTGCGLCKHTGWLEVAGAGMIHPEVLKMGGIDPEVYSGYAWGMGVERQILLKYGVNDIRLFAENNMQFLKQFTTL